MQSNPGRPGRSPTGGAVAVIAALGSERRVLERAAGAADGCAIYQSGPGAAAARATAAQAVGDGAGRLLAWGLAGGLVPGARTGMLALPARIVGVEGAPVNVDRDWRSQLETLLAAAAEIVAGDLATVATVLTTPAAKSSTAVTLGAVAADMESLAIGEVALEAGLPFVAIRAIADGADDRLPDGIATLVDDRGDLRVLRAIARILSAPADALLLASLGRLSARAHRTLARAAAELAAGGFGCDAQPAGALR